MNRRPRCGRNFSLVRCLRILRALDAARLRGVTIRELRAAVGVQRRTLYRDLDAIREAGWKIDTEHETGEAVLFLVGHAIFH